MPQTSPEALAKKHTWMREYNARPDVKAKQRAAQRIYSKSAAGRATTKRYLHTDKGRAKRRRFSSKSPRRAWVSAYRKLPEKRRLQVLYRARHRLRKLGVPDTDVIYTWILVRYDLQRELQRPLECC